MKAEETKVRMHLRESEKRCSSHNPSGEHHLPNIYHKHPRTHTNTADWPWLFRIRRPSQGGFSLRCLWGMGLTDVEAASHSANRQHNTISMYSTYAWHIHFLCVYWLLHNGRVVMRGVKGSVLHLIGCSRMTPPWAASSLAHTCPAKQRSAAAASLWRIKENK